MHARRLHTHARPPRNWPQQIPETLTPTADSPLPLGRKVHARSTRGDMPTHRRQTQTFDVAFRVVCGRQMHAAAVQLCLNSTAAVSSQQHPRHVLVIRKTPDFLVTCQRHTCNICCEDATRKLLPCNLGSIKRSQAADPTTSVCDSTPRRDDFAFRDL